MVWKLRDYCLSTAFAIISCLTIIGCSSENNQNNIKNNTNINDTKVLKLLYWQAPTILNPHLSTGFKDSEASRITLEPLATLDENSQLIPVLAEEIPSLENGGLSKDGLSVTWKLRKDIKWSNGVPFTAKDVVFTFNFITNPEVGSVSSGDYATVKSVEAIDDYTVKINFKNATPSWYTIFVGNSGLIIPEYLYNTYNGINSRSAPYNFLPVGTGPYRVVQFKPGDSVIYERNPHFREPEKLNFEQIEIKGGGDATSSARAVLQTGDADYAYNLQVEAGILNNLAQKGKGKIVNSFGSFSERILLNYTDPNRVDNDGSRASLKFPHPFFSNPRVRQAFALAIDKESIASQLYGASGKPTSNFLVAPPEYVSPTTKSEFNLTKAGEILDAEGWQDTNNNGIRDKDGVEMKVVFQTSVNPLRQKTQEIVKQNLQSLGIEVELKSIDASVFFSSDPSNDDTVEHFYADMQMYTTGNLNPDPITYFKTYTCDTIPQASNNWTGDNHSRYCNPEYDKLWQSSTTELNSDKRRELFIKMNNLLVNEAVLIPLIHRADVIAISNNLQGVRLTPWDMNTWNIAEWRKVN